MNKYIKIGAVLLVALFSAAGHAASAVAVFKIENMTCAGCRYIVKRSMANVEGVQDVDVSYKERRATVAFDTVLTNPKAIAEASAANGYLAALTESSR